MNRLSWGIAVSSFPASGRWKVCPRTQRLTFWRHVSCSCLDPIPPPPPLPQDHHTIVGCKTDLVITSSRGTLLQPVLGMFIAKLNRSSLWRRDGEPGCHRRHAHSNEKKSFFPRAIGLIEQHRRFKRGRVLYGTLLPRGTEHVLRPAQRSNNSNSMYSFFLPYTTPLPGIRHIPGACSQPINAIQYY